MRSFEWFDLLRLFAVLATLYGAYVAYRRLPTPVRLNGRRYYPTPNGAFATIWGRPVKDAALLLELTEIATRARSAP